MTYQNKYKGTSFIKPFSPKRPVKSFLDLEIYQKALAICVVVVKNISGQQELQDMVLAIPRLIATAHSLRFSDHEKSIAILEDCMLKCNLAVVYLEQYRDLWRPAPDVARPLESGDSVTVLSSSLVEDQVDSGRSQNDGNGDNSTSAGKLPEGKFNFGTGAGFFEEQTKNLLSLRMKIMRLQISWKKFKEDKKFDD